MASFCLTRGPLSKAPSLLSHRVALTGAIVLSEGLQGEQMVTGSAKLCGREWQTGEEQPGLNSRWLLVDLGPPHKLSVPLLSP